MKRATIDDTVRMAGKLQNKLRSMKHALHIEQYLIGEGRRTDGIGVSIYPGASITLNELEDKIREMMKDELRWFKNIEMEFGRHVMDEHRELLVRFRR